MKLLEHLQSEWIGAVRKASAFFLAPGVEVKKGEVVSNLVSLVSAINAQMIKIPRTYPKPKSWIIELWFNSILQAGGSMRIRLPSETEYRTLEWEEKDNFIAQCDTLRFTLIEDAKDPGMLLIDITQ